MAQRRSPPPLSTNPGEPFAHAAEAWFWGAQCLHARAEGARAEANRGLTARPCDPEDLLLGIDRLHRARRLSVAHLRTLWEFGVRAVAPNPKRRTKALAATLWNEALDLLAGPWRQKGIIR